MSENLSLNEIKTALDCEQSFINGFKDDLTMHISKALSDEKMTILSEFARMSIENKGVAELPITINLKIQKTKGKYQSTGSLKFVRKSERKVDLEPSTYDFNQPELNFNATPEPTEEEKKADKEISDQAGYNKAIEFMEISKTDKVTVMAIKEALGVSAKKAAAVVESLVKAGQVEKINDTEFKINPDLKKGVSK